MIGDIIQLEKARMAYKNGTLKQSYLITGPWDIGKKDFAIAFSAMIFCETKDNCGKCKGCKKTNSFSNPDFYVLDEEGQIKIDSIRELNKKLNLKPYEFESKVALIIGAERMTIEAANSLLKILEEPPEDSVIILTSAVPGQLLETIKSRCQDIKLKNMPKKMIVEELIKNHGLKSDEALRIANIALGRPKLAEKLVVNDDYGEEVEFLREIAKKNLCDRFKLASDFAEKKNVLRLIGYWETFFMDLLKAKMDGRDDLSTTKHKVKDFSWDIWAIVNILDILEKMREYIQSKIKNKLILENIFLNI
ncbi:MAG: polymerase III, delta prime subunit protein [candidate division CPR2 bacterium GW2011_GWC1_39_9]|uniref:Polymerase III, delta prime subunit protein n=1 Tax=candidate division CPR2 bacterium GW2011_GWC2_39_10 TaxID=1618345 RepID=A0A0G0PZ25_UNCC2|nr:MAG: polymerase III, delta prime subunit protein [candidate division CPR2 bacterium GW2011_GWC2_39_10]KKR32607.1 MAG: polymerase III, delta prime subunit protein [candidate division CPR2 bacterium GW2011_GWC1_39_9]